ncbi:hypothetical protein [Chroococcidiopsis sp. SAG 2025]|nr:hypothetical protein [Chroococcidiopsis sp. SAG 2025]
MGLTNQYRLVSPPKATPQHNPEVAAAPRRSTIDRACLPTAAA